jgi:hypothetical protein
MDQALHVMIVALGNSCATPVYYQAVLMPVNFTTVVESLQIEATETVPFINILN